MSEEAEEAALAAYRTEVERDPAYRTRLDRIAALQARSPRQEPRWLGRALLAGGLAGVAAIVWAVGHLRGSW